MNEQTNVQHPNPRIEDAPEEVAQRLTIASVSGSLIAIVSDSLDAWGLRGQVMDAYIGPIAFAPAALDPQDPYGGAPAFIDSLAPGTIAVVATGGDDRRAYWGELFSPAALRTRCGGHRL